MTGGKHGGGAAQRMDRRRAVASGGSRRPADLDRAARPEPVRRARAARRPGGGFGRLRVFAQCGTWRSQALGLKVRPQCGHCRKSLVSRS